MKDDMVTYSVSEATDGKDLDFAIAVFVKEHILTSFDPDIVKATVLQASVEREEQICILQKKANKYEISLISDLISDLE